jgi:drug/metabolite transporter (DMT)-like permease
MNWFFLALVAPLLWSGGFFIDKYLVSRLFKRSGIGVPSFISSVIGFLLLPVILIFDRSVLAVSPWSIILLLASGVIYQIALLPYFLSLQKEDTSLVIPYFQSVPVFSYFLGLLFLGEQLSKMQIIASLFVILASVGISFDFRRGQKKFRSDIFGLMMLSSFLFALNSFIFKFVAIKDEFWTTSFWEYSGFTLYGLSLLLIPSLRRRIFQAFHKHKLLAFTINGVNELLNIAAKMIFNFASLLAPLALIWVANSTQPLFTLFLGVILTLSLPKIFKENLSWRIFLEKLAFIIIMGLGIYLLNAG